MVRPTTLGKIVSGLMIVALIALGIYLVGPGAPTGKPQVDVVVPTDPITLEILVGGEKLAFLENPRVQAALKEHGITLNYSRAGSVEMVTTMNTEGKDALWPSNQIAVELAAKANKPIVGSPENIFNSPIVFYAWGPVTDALMAKRIVEKRGNSYYVAKSSELVRMAIDGKRWKEDLGLNIYGPIRIFSTDPMVSNSGNIWAGLLANTIKGEVVTPATLVDVLPQLQTYFASMGNMERSSGDIFENMLNQGMGARPLVVGYENQLVEYVLEHRDRADYIKSRIRILYPEPTIFASHPLILLSRQAHRLTEVLRSPPIQTIAWQHHGFRTGMIGVQSDAAVLSIGGIPETIEQVMPMPSAAVMQAIMDGLRPREVERR